MRHLGVLSPTLGRLVESLNGLVGRMGALGLSMPGRAAHSGNVIDATIVSPPVAGGLRAPPVQAARATGAAATGAGAAGTIGALAAPLAVAAVAVTGFAATVRMAAKMVERETARLGEYSGMIAGAAAQTDIARERSAMRRAERLGPQLVDAEGTRRRFEEVQADIMTSIYQLLLTWYEANKITFNIILSILTAISKSMEVMAELLGSLIDFLTLNWLDMKDHILDAWKTAKQAAEDLKDIWTGGDDDPLDDPFIKDWLGVDPAQQRQIGQQNGGAP